MFAPAPEGGPKLPQDLRVLLVEDNPGDVTLLRKMLSRDRLVTYRLETASSLEEALETAGRGHYDLVLLDLGLPDSSGLDTLRSFRSGAPDVPVVVLTGLQDEEAGMEALSEGAQDYLVKSLADAESLHRSIRFAIERAGRSSLVEHLNRVLRSIRNVNQLIVRETDPERLISRTCGILLEERGYRSAWIVIDRPGEASPGPLYACRSVSREQCDAFLEMVEGGRLPECCDLLSDTPVKWIDEPEDNCAGCPLRKDYGESDAIVGEIAHGGHRFGYIGVSSTLGTTDPDEELSLLSEAAGDIAFALHSIRTGRRGARSEEELERSRERFRAIFTGQPVAAFVMSMPDLRVMYANEAAVRQYGYAAEEMEGMTPDRFDSPERAAMVPERIAELEAEGRIEFESVHLRSDGSSFPVHVSGALVELEEGSRAMLALCRDVSSRKRAERALVESEERYRNYVESAPIGVALLDRELVMREVNRALCDMVGRPAEELAGTSLLELVPEGTWDRTVAAFGSVDGRGRVSLDMPFLKADGGRGTWMLEAALHDGHYLCYLGDTTERSGLEAQLRQAQKMEAIGQLAGGVAHDFNNLLQVMGGYASIALEMMESRNPARASVEEISTACDRAARLVSQLLAMSRRQVLSMDSVDLNEVVASVREMLDRVIGERIEIELVQSRELGMVRADRGHIEQVLMNLCINARDAMPEGGRLTLETENVLLDEGYCRAHHWASPGRYVLLSVTDTGKGMEAEVLEHIFEPFFTTKGAERGTGLGLSTVYGIVRQHEGMITAYSEPGVGSTFKVYLPLVERRAADVGSKLSGPVGGGDETILLAEDDDLVRNLTVRILERAGYTVVTAVDGRQALERMRELPEGSVQLALLDVVMPEMDGHEVYEALRRDHPDIRFLFASGYSMNSVHTSFVLDEDIKLLQKPFAPDELLRRVREILDSTG